MVNRDLDADFDLSSFDHVVKWDDRHEWIEMRLRSNRDHSVYIRALDLTVHFAQGEELRTEISAKFRRATLEAEFAKAGLRLAQWWTDAEADFAVSLVVLA